VKKEHNLFKHLNERESMGYDFVITSGYFNPLHVGHIECFEKAKELGNKLIVIINNDEQVKIKGSQKFMNEQDRLTIVGALKCVDYVRLSIDKDKSVCKSIASLSSMNLPLDFKKHKVCFAKGGDRCASEVPEASICKTLGITMVDGLGKKIRKSSDTLKQAKTKTN